MNTFASMLDDACAAEGLHLIDMVWMGHAGRGRTSASTLALHAIVAIPDIYGNNAILKQDPASAYGSAAENFTPRMARKVNMAA